MRRDCTQTRHCRYEADVRQWFRAPVGLVRRKREVAARCVVPIGQVVTVVTSKTAVMVTLFLGNYEFEHRLSWRDERPLSGPVRKLAEDLASVWLAVAADDDVIWTPAPVEPGFFEGARQAGLPRVRAAGSERDVPSDAQLSPWGWTDSLHDWCQTNGWSCDAPAESVVREVNSRLFSVRLEQEWDVGLEATAVVRSQHDLQEATRRLPADAAGWAIKAEFGMSGRERILGRGREVSAEHSNWLAKRLARDGAAVFEPWVDHVEETGVQFTVPKAGPPVFEGLTPMIADASGTYRGSRIVDEKLVKRWSAAIDVCRRAAERIQQLGYFGPLGIDAAYYREGDGSLGLRPLQDINARYTMGRLALGFRRLLQPGEAATWLHLNRKSAGVKQADTDWESWLADQLPADSRFLRTSPLRVADRETEHITVLVIAESSETLSECEARLAPGGAP